MGKSTNGGICPHKSGISKEDAWVAYKGRHTYIGRKHVVPKAETLFKSGFDERRMQLNRRNLKPCPFCSQEFGTNEMARHKRAEHAEAMKAQRLAILAAGRKQNVDGARLVS